MTVYGSSLGAGSSGECSVSGARWASKKVVVLSCTTRVAPTLAAASSTRPVPTTLTASCSPATCVWPPSTAAEWTTYSQPSTARSTRVGVGDVAPHDLDAQRLERAGLAALTDQGADGVALLDELLGDVGADHPRRAGEEDAAHACPLSVLRTGALGPRCAARRDTRLAAAPLTPARSRCYAPGRSAPAALLAGIPGSRPLRSRLPALGAPHRGARPPLRCSPGYPARDRSAHGFALRGELRLDRVHRARGPRA